MKTKKILFYFIILLPLSLIFTFLSSLIFNIVKIKNMNYEELSNKLSKYLLEEKGKVSVNYGNNKVEVLFVPKNKSIVYKPKKTEIDFNYDKKDKLIYVFGSSPVVAKLPFYGNNILFPSILEENIVRKGYGYKVYNFGISSFDSFDIKECFAEALKKLPKPEVIVFYEGHMDYEAAYYSVIKPNFYLLNNYFFDLVSGINFLNRVDNWEKFIFMGRWLIRSIIAPRVLFFCQQIGVLRLNSQEFERFNQKIVASYKINVNTMINYAKMANIPFVIITPVCNLEAKPYGDMKTNYLYEAGLKEKHYFKRIEYLKKAKASEFISADIMAKPSLNEFLRNLKSPGVYVYDLERYLVEKKFSFNYKYFYDGSHIKPNLHRIIGESLFNFLNEKRLINGLL